MQTIGIGTVLSKFTFFNKFYKNFITLQDFCYFFSFSVKPGNRMGASSVNGLVMGAHAKFYTLLPFSLGWRGENSHSW